MRALKWVAVGLLVLFACVQLIPYGTRHLNPPVSAEPSWPTPEARALAARACFDCHSNQTHWPWYSYVAPASWLLERDVSHGRAKLNFSEWDRPQSEADEASEEVLEGEMPLAIYTVVHRDALLTPFERRQLADALDSMAGASTEPHGGLDVD